MQFGEDPLPFVTYEANTLCNFPEIIFVKINRKTVKRQNKVLSRNAEYYCLL